MRHLIAILMFGLLLCAGCRNGKPYGVEQQLYIQGRGTPIWAVAPAVNLSGQPQVDPLLQADILYAQAQQINGLIVIPVNRVVEAYSALQLDGIYTPEQAAQVCELLKCDGLMIATITAYDPFNPPKLGASLQIFKVKRDPAGGAPTVKLHQAVGMYDAVNGSVREQIKKYATGRHQPLGPLGVREYYVNMDRFCGFVYHTLLADLVTRTSMRD